MSRHGDGLAQRTAQLVHKPELVCNHTLEDLGFEIARELVGSLGLHGNHLEPGHATVAAVLAAGAALALLHHSPVPQELCLALGIQVSRIPPVWEPVAVRVLFKTGVL